MKRTLLIMLIGLLFVTVEAQDKNSKKRLSREEKKELKRQQEEKAVKIVSAIIDDKRFILEADYIRNRYGQSLPVNSNINFVAVDSTRAIFQFGSAHTVGINGVGGVTIEGRITSFDVQKREKSGSYYIHINISATTGFYEIQLDVTSTGMASAQVTALSRHRIEYSGRLAPLNQSRVFKGTSY